MASPTPFDPTRRCTAEPAIKDIAPGGDALVPRWKPLDITRRNFPRSVVCSGTVIAGTAFIFSTPSPARADTRAVEWMIKLTVNGCDHNVDFPPNRTLAYTIRFRLGLTGTKLGCNKADCGACSVIQDGTTIFSCSTLTHQVRGNAITTIDGVEAADGTLHLVQ